MAETFVTVAGTLVMVALFVPHATTVPLLRSARLKNPPAATAVTFDAAAGIFVCPAVLSPQTTACAPAKEGTAFINSKTAKVTRTNIIAGGNGSRYGFGKPGRAKHFCGS